MFHFEKWYMDATDEDGRALVAYHASLKWRLLTLVYNGFTFLPDLASQTQLKKQSSFSLTNIPEYENGKVSWNCFGVNASWAEAENSIAETLYASKEGDILWQCVFPKADAKVDINGVVFSQAKGYVEKIVLTIPPWKIPIHQLHWGRFLSDHHYIVWIRWIGPVPKNVIFHNGERSEDGTISEFCIRTKDFELQLKNPRTLRKGTILSTVFANFPSIKKVFPRSIMNLKENKWASAGELYHHSELIARGNAIHELVVW